MCVALRCSRYRIGKNIGGAHEDPFPVRAHTFKDVTEAADAFVGEVGCKVEFVCEVIETWGKNAFLRRKPPRQDPPVGPTRLGRECRLWAETGAAYV